MPRFAIAFQPIVSPAARRVVAHEALLRGHGGTPAGGVFALIPRAARARFEPIALAAARLAFAATGAGSALHVNACARTVLASPAALDPLGDAAAGRVVVELAEGEGRGEAERLALAAAEVRARGLAVALDGFGRGYDGPALLDAVKPSVAKLDMSLCRNIHLHRARRSIVTPLLAAASARGIAVIALGVESEGEHRCLAGLGVTLFQGFLFCPPVTGEAPREGEIAWPAADAPPSPAADPAVRERFARDL